METEYSKLALDTTDIIERLKTNGLGILDEKEAVRKLGIVSYFRIAAYLRPMEDNKETHHFKPGSTLENAFALYEFDTKLRQLIFAAIQEIEIALRAKIIQHFSLMYGPFWFMDATLSVNERLFSQNLAAIDRELERSREDFIKAHFKKYVKPAFPPAWKTLELASFGTLSKLYYNFLDNKVKKTIAREFNLPNHEMLESWMRSISSLRNCCAHHARIWNRRLSATPQMTGKIRGSWVYHMEKARVFDPFGHAGFDPSGKIRLTP
ncbi:MAG: Abi family protein [Muribaculaceae bacterium]|nr:Abi family protein [Muribaculaceae bacterium]